MTLDPRSRPRFLPGWPVRAPVVLFLLGVLLRPVWAPRVNDPGLADQLAFCLGFFAFLLYTGWFLARSGLRVRTRWLLFTLCVLLPYGTFFALFEPVGVTGMVAPEFAWRWRDRRPVVAPVPTPGPAPDLSSPAATDSPQFLGPSRDGLVPDAGLSTDWQTTPPRMLWRQPVGEGWSSFAVCGGWAVTMAQYGPEEHTLCLDAETGRVAWTHAEAARHSTTLGGVGPRSTPTIVNGLVYSLGATGILCCLDGRDGSVRWRVALQEHLGLDQAADEGMVAWGRAGSPLVSDGMVVVPGGGPKGRSVSLIAFDAETGEERWRGGTDQISYSSPILATLGGRRQIVIVNEASVSGHDPKDGRTLWSHGFPGSSRGHATVAQAVVVDDGHVFLSKGYGVGARLIAVRRAADGSWASEVVWEESRRMRTKFTSAVLVGDRLFGLNERRVECIAAADGSLVWSGERYGHGQCLAVGESLIVLGDDGVVALVDRGTGKERGRFRAVAGKTWSVPTLAGDLLLLRNSVEAACYRLPRR